ERAEAPVGPGEQGGVGAEEGPVQVDVEAAHGGATVAPPPPDPTAEVDGRDRWRRVRGDRHTETHACRHSVKPSPGRRCSPPDAPTSAWCTTTSMTVARGGLSRSPSS